MVYLINCVVMFKGRRLEPCENNCPRGVCSLMSSVTALRVPSPVESFYREEVDTPLGTSKAVTYRNDIYLVLNQRRLDSMSLAQFSDYLDHDRSASQLSELRGKMSDAQLHQFVKSRYIQHIGELRAWQSYLDAEFAGEVQKYQDSLKSAPADPAPADPAPASAPASAPAVES